MGAPALLLILPLLSPLPGAYPTPGPRADSMGSALASSISSSDRKVSGITSPVQGTALTEGPKNYCQGARQKKEKQEHKLS